MSPGSVAGLSHIKMGALQNSVYHSCSVGGTCSCIDNGGVVQSTSIASSRDMSP